MENAKKKIYRRVVFTALSVIFVFVVIAGYTVYSRVLAPNTKNVEDNGVFVYIPTGASFSDVQIAMQYYLKDDDSFEWTAGMMKYDKFIKQGRYLIENGMSNRAIISLLRSGRQKPVRVTFNNIRTIEQLAGRISQQIEADSNSIVTTFKDTGLQMQNGFTMENSISIIIPNTYEFYWNTLAPRFYQRMLKEYNIFWNDARKQKAAAIGLTKEQVSVIASIVEQETQQESEKKVIAGVYINRFRKLEVGSRSNTCFCIG